MQRQELIMSQLAKAGIRVKLTPVGPGPAMQNFMLEQKGAMLFSPTGGYPDPSQFYEALFAKDALRNAGKVELPGYRELVDATMEAMDQTDPQGSLRQAATLRDRAGAAGAAIHRAEHHDCRVRRCRTLADNLPTTPKFTEVWLASA